MNGNNLGLLIAKSRNEVHERSDGTVDIRISSVCAYYLSVYVEVVHLNLECSRNLCDGALCPDEKVVGIGQCYGQIVSGQKLLNRLGFLSRGAVIGRDLSETQPSAILRRTRIIEVRGNRIELLPIVNIQPNRYLYRLGWVRRTDFGGGLDEWRRIIRDRMACGRISKARSSKD